MSYLQDIITRLMKGEVGKPQELDGVAWTHTDLGGGARLWWDGQGQRIAATRPNGPLQTNEAAIFGVHIKRSAAGFVVGKWAPITIHESTLNDYIGAVWVLRVAGATQEVLI